MVGALWVEVGAVGPGSQSEVSDRRALVTNYVLPILGIFLEETFLDGRYPSWKDLTKVDLELSFFGLLGGGEGSLLERVHDVSDGIHQGIDLPAGLWVRDTGVVAILQT